MDRPDSPVGTAAYGTIPRLQRLLQCSMPSRPVRILVCLLYYRPHRTGLTLYVQRLAERLAARGEEVTVLCARHDPRTPLGEAVENGVRVVRLRPFARAISRGMVMPGYPAALRRLAAECDLVSVHTPIFESALIGRVARRLGRPVVCTHHGDLVLPGGLGNRLIAAAMFALYRRMARTAAAFVAPSRDYAESSSYLRPYLDRLAVIPPLVEIPLPDPARARELRARWAPEGGPVIGYAGRLVEEKRPDLLVRALATVNARHPHARLVFAGQRDVAYESFWRRQRDLERRYHDQLRFLGVVADAREMADFYAACDVLALPSDTECFALVQVEAMLCGTPVVMTDVPGGRVPVQATGMGVLVPPRDPEALGAGILRVLADRDRYLRPRPEIERLFSAEATVDRYQELFGRLCGAGRSRSAACAP